MGIIKRIFSLFCRKVHSKHLLFLCRRMWVRQAGSVKAARKARASGYPLKCFFENLDFWPPSPKKKKTHNDKAHSTKVQKFHTVWGQGRKEGRRPRGSDKEALVEHFSQLDRQELWQHVGWRMHGGMPMICCVGREGGWWSGNCIFILTYSTSNWSKYLVLL